MKKEIEVCFLDDFPSLTEGVLSLVNISKNQIQKYLSKKSLKQKVYKQQIYNLPLDIINYNRINPIYVGKPIKKIDEDDLFYVVSKPAKIHCHPHSYCEHDNVLSGLLSENIRHVLNVNSDKYDRGLLYRLDFETSGLLILTKSNELLGKIRTGLNDFIKTKIYLAVVEGKFQSTENIINYLEPFGEKNSKMRVTGAVTTLLAKCDTEFIEYNSDKNMSLIKVRLYEGHRHQIRVQLSNLGHPIIGDDLYGSREWERMLLHCYHYTIKTETIERSFKDSNLDFLSGLFNFDGKL